MRFFLILYFFFQILPQHVVSHIRLFWDSPSSTFLKVITTVSAYMKLLEPTPVTKWVKWTKLCQIWARFGPNQPTTANFESRDPRLWVLVRF